MEERAFDLIERKWKLVVLLVWLGFCAVWIFEHYDAIRWFRLGDTDDNMRMMQVRALLHGQGWFDLRRIETAWTEHQSGRHNHGHLLWNVLMAQAWSDRWFAAQSVN